MTNSSVGATSEGTSLASQYIDHMDSRQKYAPPDHAGTVNVRLTDKTFCENFELVLGRVQVGGKAFTHHHKDEHQAIYVVSGCAMVTLGTEEPVECGPGTVIRLPPLLDHHVLAVGDEPFEAIIIYSPPLPKRNDVDIAEE